MLYYNRIDLIEAIDVAKSNNSEKCVICHYCYFNHGYKFQDFIYNDCHDLAMLSLYLNDIAITVIVVDYRCVVHDISKSAAIHLLKSFILGDHGYI